MSTVETRVREALHEDVGRHEADLLLVAVRRGVQVRRRRRTAALAAAAALVLAAAGGGIAWHRHRAPVADHPQSTLLTGPVSVSVDATGAAYKVVDNEGCTQPCSAIWKADATGRWTRLAAISDSSRRGRLFGVVHALQMAPNGRDGWAWGTNLWSTHDGGSTWTRVTAAPADASYLASNLDISPGPAVTWALFTTQQGPQLWRTPTGSDTWTRVTLPHGTGQSIAAVLPDSRVALPHGYQRARHGGKVVRLIARYAVGDGTGPWQQVMVPCVTIRMPFSHLHKAMVCGPGGHSQGSGSIGGPTPPPGTPRFKDLLIEMGSTGPEPHNPLGHEGTLNVTTRRAVLATVHGPVPAHLHLRTLAGLNESAWSGSHVVLLNSDHRIYVSDDGGRHWREQ